MRWSQEAHETGYVPLLVGHGRQVFGTFISAARWCLLHLHSAYHGRHVNRHHTYTCMCILIPVFGPSQKAEEQQHGHLRADADSYPDGVVYDEAIEHSVGSTGLEVEDEEEDTPEKEYYRLHPELRRPSPQRKVVDSPRKGTAGAHAWVLTSGGHTPQSVIALLAKPPS